MQSTDGNTNNGAEPEAQKTMTDWTRNERFVLDESASGCESLDVVPSKPGRVQVRAGGGRSGSGSTGRVCGDQSDKVSSRAGV